MVPTSARCSKSQHTEGAVRVSYDGAVKVSALTVLREPAGRTPKGPLNHEAGSCVVLHPSCGSERPEIDRWRSGTLGVERRQWDEPVVHSRCSAKYDRIGVFRLP